MILSHPFTRSVQMLLAFGLPLLTCHCSWTAGKSGKEAAEGYWIGDTVKGEPKIVIDLSKQRVRYFKGGQLVGVSLISSGRESHATCSGCFHIMEKDRDHRSSLYGAYVAENGEVVKADVDARKDPCPPGAKFQGANMPHFMRIFSGIGMHAGYLPGYPASHGCIRLPARMAEIFFEATPSGTPVEIVGAAGAYQKENHEPIVPPPGGALPALEVRKAKPKDEHWKLFQWLLPTPKAMPATNPAPRPKIDSSVNHRPPTAAATRAAKPAPRLKAESHFFQRLFSAPKAAAATKPAPAAKPKPKAAPAAKPKPKPAPKSKSEGNFFQRLLRKPPPGTTLYL